jgi:hypothetical protein
MNLLNPFAWSNLWQGITIIVLTLQTGLDAYLIHRIKRRQND